MTELKQLTIVYTSVYFSAIKAICDRFLINSPLFKALGRRIASAAYIPLRLSNNNNYFRNVLQLKTEALKATGNKWSEGLRPLFKSFMWEMQTKWQLGRKNIRNADKNFRDVIINN